MELDIFIPQLSLGFEVHGNQHFKDTFNSSLSQKTRDKQRREKCNNLGITLIEIPYWIPNENLTQLITHKLIQERHDLHPIFNSGSEIT